jgi:outer membrane protein OmpA-like peptidoglycan-associated protein
LAFCSGFKFFIVGHTDTVGNYAHNVDLSNRRAVAVAAVLVKDFKIDRNRLQSVGIGPAAPIGSNASEEGRAKNRRVETVLRQ